MSNTRSFIFLLNNDKNTLFFNVNKFYTGSIYSTSLAITNNDDFSDEVKQFICDNLIINGHSIYKDNNIENTPISFNIENTDELQDVVYSFVLKDSFKDSVKLNLSLTVEPFNDNLSTDTFNIVLYIDNNLSFNNIYKQTANLINTKHSSFMLSRTNPKLTGNIKLVVDEDYHLYLDTFKVTEVLSDKKYRHQPISTDGNYPRDIKAVFSSLPQGELFKFSEDSLKVTKAYDSYDYQYNGVYEYGAETNKDMLYKENMKILAPLYIGHDNLPDFFCIFKISKNVDSDYSSNDTEIINQYFKNGEVVKIFDLRKYTTIGQYLNNYKSMLNEVQTGAHIQFIEQENTDNTWKNGTDYWSGVSVDRGVLTSKMETTFFQNNIIQNIGTNESLYGYILDGYERNNLLYPNILNLEFMFNDETADDYSISKYAGFYLKENDVINYGGIIKDYSDNVKQILTKFDSSFTPIKDDSFVDEFINDSALNDRIKFIITDNDAQKVNNSVELNTYISNNIVNRPEKNIINVNAVEVDLLQDLNIVDSTENLYTLKHSDQKKTDAITQSFLSMKFTEPLHYGEHLRIVTFENYKPTIFEIIASNDKRLVNTKYNITQYIQTNKRFLDYDNNSSVYFASSVLFGQSNENGLGSPDNPNVNIAKVENTSLFSYQEFDNDGKLTQIKQSVLDFPYHYLTWDSKENYQHGSQSQYTKKDTLWTENHIDDYPEIYRLAFYTQDLDDESQTASLKDQIERIVQCIRKFNSKDFYVSSYSEDSLAIISENKETYFQHIDKPYLELTEDYLSDKIYYFTDKNIVSMYPLSCETSKFDKDTYGFALYNFELLGDRYSSVVKFIKFENYCYNLLKSIRNNSRMEDCLLALSYGSESTNYKPLDKFNIETYNIAVNIDVSAKHLTTFTDRIIINPFNVNNDFVYSSVRLVLQDGVLKLYSPKSYSVSLMGVFGFKDFYTYFNLTNNKIYHSNNRYSFSKNTDLKQYIKQGILYKLISGSIKNININTGKAFFYIDGVVYYYDKNDRLQTKTVKNLIVGSNNTTIETETENTQDFDFITSTPVISYNNLYSPLNSTNDLTYPITVPSIFVWESTGVYYDRNSDLDINNLNAFNNNEGYFTNLNYSLGNYDSDNFVFNNFNSNYIDADSDELVSIKNQLLNKDSKTDNLIRQTLINNFNIKGSTAYYNKYINTLDFIYYGIKFTIKINNTDYLLDINLEDYNNYEVFVVNSYNTNTNKNEIYISTKERIILLINNIYNKTKEIHNENIIYELNNNLNNELNYYWETADYGVDVNNILCNGKRYFLSTDNENASLNTDEILYQIYTPNSESYSSGTSYIFYLKNYIDAYGLNTVASTSSGFVFAYSADENISNKKLFMNTQSGSSSMVYDDSYTEVAINNSLTVNNKSLNIFNNFFNTNYASYLLISKSSITLADKSSEDNTNTASLLSLNLPLTDNILGEVKFVTEDETTTEYESTTNPEETSTLVETTTAVQSSESTPLYKDLEDYIESSLLNQNLDFIVIDENDVAVYSNINDSYQPIELSIETLPTNIKYNYDFYEPKFFDLIDFDLNESESTNTICNRSFLLANTHLKQVNTIPVYVGTKVFKNIPNFNLTENYFVDKNKNIAKSIWSQKTYRLYSSQNKYSTINGYTIGTVGGKNMMGSMCIKLPQKDKNVVVLSIDTWNYEQNLLSYSLIDSDNNTKTENTKECSIRINLTKAFYDYFLYDERAEAFRKQWNLYAVNTRTYILNFLKNSLIRFFNINNQQNLIVYKKVLNQKNENPSILYEMPQDFNTDAWEACLNYKTSYQEINEEIILTITISDYKNSQIYPLFKIYRK